MTDQELKDLVASLAVDRKEFEAYYKKFHEEEVEARKKFREEFEESLKKSREEFDKQMARINAQSEKNSREIGGISNNQGYHAEQFFQDVFEKKLEFGGVKYDEMIPNLAHKSKKGEIEFDIALVNGDSIALIEVKNRIHPNFVKELAEERVDKFKEFFREFENYKVYLGIAGFSFSDEVLDRASAYGIGVVKQVGEGVEISAERLRVY